MSIPAAFKFLPGLLSYGVVARQHLCDEGRFKMLVHSCSCSWIQHGTLIMNFEVSVLVSRSCLVWTRPGCAARLSLFPC